MKILLIYPYFLEERIHTEEISAVPMGLYSIGTVLKECGHDVEILNWHDAYRSPGLIEKTLTEKMPDLIGVSIFHANRWGGIDIARKAKEIDPRVTVVFGGIGATFLWEHLLTHFEAVDYVVIGEGEATVRELIRLVESGRGQEAETIAGLALRRGNRVIRTAERPPVADLDSLPIAAGHFTYQHLSLTRGCPANCSFCGSPGFWGRKVRYRSAEHFVKEIELLYKKGVTFFYISDDTFTLEKDRVIEICREILRRGICISWAAISRVDLVNESVLSWMRRAGCIQVSYGVESGSEKIRRALNKRIRIGQVRQAFAWTRKYGIMARAYFIYGCPGETWDTIQETLDLVEQIQPLGAIFYILDIFPGTELYEDYKKKFSLDDDIWLERVEDILYFETDSGLDRDTVLAFGSKLRQSFYQALPGYTDAVELVDDRKFFPLHADFCSRLAMTFDHGDYAAVDDVPRKTDTAEGLYRRALAYWPDPRAYLGLGILLQKSGRYGESLKVLKKGIGHFPEHCQLHLCAAVSEMNLGDPQSALAYLLPFEKDKTARRMILDCYRALGDEDAVRRIEAMPSSRG